MTSIPGYKQLCQMTRRPHGAFTQGERLERVVRPKKRRSIFGILAMLKSLGLTSLNRRLVWLASCSFVSGLSQAALLVVVSELAVSGAQGGDRLKLHGLSLSLHESILVCVLLLVLFSVSSMASAFAGAQCRARRSKPAVPRSSTLSSTQVGESNQRSRSVISNNSSRSIAKT